MVDGYLVQSVQINAQNDCKYLHMTDMSQKISLNSYLHVLIDLPKPKIKKIWNRFFDNH